MNFMNWQSDPLIKTHGKTYAIRWWMCGVRVNKYTNVISIYLLL